MKNYFIIHGTFGHNKENWFGWLEDELLKMGCEVFNFNYPTPEGHNFENWSNVLNKVKNKITDKSVFVCHSSAPIFLIKYCLTNNIEIGKLISVSGANNFKVGVPEFDDINKLMFVDDVSNFKNDYIPTVKALEINKSRIIEKVNLKPDWYRWTKRNKPDWI